MNKWDYIREIKRLSYDYKGDYTDRLIKIIYKCDKTNLCDVTCEEAREFYKKLIERKGE